MPFSFIKQGQGVHGRVGRSLGGEERKRVLCCAGRGPAGPPPPSLGQIEPERHTDS